MVTLDGVRGHCLSPIWGCCGGISHALSYGGTSEALGSWDHQDQDRLARLAAIGHSVIQHCGSCRLRHDISVSA